MAEDKNVVIIYSKWPELGKCKTRIAEETSHKFALDFTIACMDDLIENLRNSDYYDLIVGADSERDLGRFKDKYGLDGILTMNASMPERKKRQSQNFNDIFGELQGKYGKMILIPMDLPFMDQEDMISSFTRMDEQPFVLGPEIDGGVYLIGMRGPFKNIFQDVGWSTSHSFTDLVKNCGEENIYRLKVRSDFNMFQEVLNARDLIAASCRNLNDLLVKNGYDAAQTQRYVDYNSLNINIPVVSAIIRKDIDGKEHILIQTRYKPSIDPENTGKLEIVNGIINKFEIAYQAAVRESREEAGLEVQVVNEMKNQGILPVHADFTSVAYQPFSITQQTMGGRAYFGANFICEFKSGTLTENKLETRNPRWVPLTELKSLIANNPDSFFGFNVPTLKQYLAYKGVI
jgi:glycosyltransferase A (GT-A) superfamily protein (DUF2064 family)/8-oxo-dGTP pyrophosphatase MutT (NUDIX family)